MSEAVATQERNVIQHGDYLIDADTGEVLSLVIEQREPFRVHDQNTAEWVMEKLTEAESEVDAIDKRGAVLLANIEAMKLPAMRRVEWLRFRFAKEMQDWTEQELAGKKERSIRLPWGRLSLRKVAARLVVDDEEKAIAWGERQMPDTVKVTKKFLVSKVEGDAIPDGAHVAPARDSFEMSTGQ